MFNTAADIRVGQHIQVLPTAHGWWLSESLTGEQEGPVWLNDDRLGGVIDGVDLEGNDIPAIYSGTVEWIQGRMGDPAVLIGVQSAGGNYGQAATFMFYPEAQVVLHPSVHDYNVALENVIQGG